MRTLGIPLLALAASLALAGCGGEKVDEGGFTQSDLKAAQRALAVLSQTSVWNAAAQATYTIGATPAECSLHIARKDPLTFKLFLSWIPAEGLYRRYAWLQAIVGPDGLKEDYSFRLRYAASEAALRSHYGDALSKPREHCLVLKNGRFALLPE